VGVRAPQTGPSVWDAREGEIRRPGIMQVVMLAAFTWIGIVVDRLGTLSIPVGFISAIWPGQTVQAVGGVWFGHWGGLAGTLFPIISNALFGSAPLSVPVAFLPANFVQSMAAGWAFRRFKADPSLKSARDWGIWIFIGVIAANLIGSFWGSNVLVFFGLITRGVWFNAWAGWFVGNTIPSLILGSLVLKFVSPIVVNTSAFCKGYWA
jgi:hypothetical protein